MHIRHSFRHTLIVSALCIFVLPPAYGAEFDEGVAYGDAASSSSASIVHTSGGYALGWADSSSGGDGSSRPPVSKMQSGAVIVESASDSGLSNPDTTDGLNGGFSSEIGPGAMVDDSYLLRGRTNPSDGAIVSDSQLLSGSSKFGPGAMVDDSYLFAGSPSQGISANEQRSGNSYSATSNASSFGNPDSSDGGSSQTVAAPVKTTMLTLMGNVITSGNGGASADTVASPVAAGLDNTYSAAGLTGYGRDETSVSAGAAPNVGLSDGGYASNSDDSRPFSNVGLSNDGNEEGDSYALSAPVSVTPGASTNITEGYGEASVAMNTISQAYGADGGYANPDSSASPNLRYLGSDRTGGSPAGADQN